MSGKSDMGEQHNYEVGYGRPPKHTRFRKGQSGNPKGKQKGRRSLKTMVREIFEKRVQIQVNGKAISMSMGEALLLRAVNDGLSGDRHAKAIALQLLERFGYPEVEDKAMPAGQKLFDSKTLFDLIRDLAENGPSADDGRSPAQGSEARSENNNE